MTPQLGSTSSRAVFFLFFLSAAAFAPPSRSAPPACSAANMPTGPTAFIATSPNLVTVLDASANTVACTIMVGNGPTNLALSPDSSQLFVENDADATVTVVTLADPSVPANISTVDLTTQGVTKPMTANLAVLPDNSRVYVVSLPATLTPTTQASLNVISLPSLTVSAAVFVVTSPAIPVTGAGLGVAFTPDASKAYIATQGATYVVTTSSDSVAPTPITASGGTAAVQQTGTFAYVVDVAADPSKVSQITTANNAVLTQTPAPGCAGAYATAITADSSLVYYTCPGSGFVQSIPAATNASVTATVPLSLTAGVPQGIAITSDGASAYVANSDGSISIVSVSANSATNTSLGTSALTGIGIRPVKLPSLSPTTATVPIGGSQQFTSSVLYAFSTGKTLIWAVNGIQGGNSTVGTIDSIGLYTAPSKINPPSSVQVIATSVSDPTVSDTSTLTLSSSITFSPIAFSPPAPLLIENADTLSASLTGDPYNQSVTWSIGGCSAATPATSVCGSISASTGLFTPPSIVPYASQSNPVAPATVTFTATSVTDSTKFSVTKPPVTITSNVAINGFQVNGAAPPAQLVIETASYTLTPVITGDTGQGVIWSILSCSVANPAASSCGKFTDAKAGTYVPPPIVPYATPVTPSSTASVTFPATSVADPLISKTL